MLAIEEFNRDDLENTLAFFFTLKGQKSISNKKYLISLLFLNLVCVCLHQSEKRMPVLKIIELEDRMPVLIQKAVSYSQNI